MMEFLPDWEEKYLPMFCASADAEERVYKKIEMGEKIWLIAVQPNAADNVYFWRPGPSEGFGGRTLTFKLEDGSQLELKGPWHSSARGLLNIIPELQFQYYTRGVISLERSYIQGCCRGVFKKVIHMEDEWVLGEFSRVEYLAQEKANELGCKVFYCSQSPGGSSSASKEPNKNPSEQF